MPQLLETGARELGREGYELFGNFVLETEEGSLKYSHRRSILSKNLRTALLNSFGLSMFTM
jgi:hypothetical protein